MLIDATSEDLIAAATVISSGVSILDSSDVGHLGSHLLIVGFAPVNTFVFKTGDADILETIEREAMANNCAAIFTLSYELGRELLNIGLRQMLNCEPYAYAALYDVIAVHDYVSGETYLRGNADRFAEIGGIIANAKGGRNSGIYKSSAIGVSSNFTRPDYIAAVEEIQEEIRKGNTYQTNLTQQITVETDPKDSPAGIFSRLRRDHPAPFAAYIDRGNSVVVSASPERLVRVENGVISASPIKGTRRRGANANQDSRLARELIASEKDRAENTMIVDLLRNDLGRICEFGSVRVEKLCELESHPTLYHLVSTIIGKVRGDVGFAEIVRAVFPSGSITGAPKISTMRIIDRIEKAPRGLSMGSIGILVPDGFHGLAPMLDINVAIRTMAISNGVAVFNVGGGIVIDSEPLLEYDESLLKAKALLNALGAATHLKN